jgi:hypothetical protein
MTVQTSFNQARAAFLSLAQSEGVVISKALLQESLNNVAQAFYSASTDEQKASAAEMAIIATAAAEFGLQKPKVKTLAV